MVGLHSNTKMDDNQEAIFHVATRAPNLRHLNIIKFPPQPGSKLWHIERKIRGRHRQGLGPRQARLPWKSINKEVFSNANKAKGRLISLMFAGDDDVTTQCH